MCLPTNLHTDSPMCVHCQKVAPEYAEAARQLKEEGSEIWLAKVDMSEESELAMKYSVKALPEMRFFSNGTAEKKYSGKAANYLLWFRLVPVRSDDLGFASLCMGYWLPMVPASDFHCGTAN